MTTPIGRIPQGFLSLLELRDMGGVPKEVTNLIAPGIDITQFLLLNRETAQGTVTFTGPTSAHPATCQVPPGELWYVHVASCQTPVLPAGDTIALNLSYTTPLQFTWSDTVSAVGGARCSAFARDLWLPAGHSIGVRVMQCTTATSIDVEVRLAISRLRI